MRDLLEYDPDTGTVTWIAHPSPRKQFMVGKPAGNYSNGYLEVMVLGQRYQLHRLIFELMGVEIPEGHEVDHINGVTDDNRWENLRLVTKAEQQRNLKRARNNKSGVTGVYWSESLGKWVAEIKKDRKKRRLYSGDNPFMAVYRRALAEYEEGFHPNHGRHVYE